MGQYIPGKDVRKFAYTLLAKLLSLQTKIVSFGTELSIKLKNPNREDGSVSFVIITDTQFFDQEELTAINTVLSNENVFYSIGISDTGKQQISVDVFSPES